MESYASKRLKIDLYEYTVEIILSAIMHSSRMRIVLCSDRLGVGEGGDLPSGGCVPEGGLCLRGVSTSGWCTQPPPHPETNTSRGQIDRRL